MLTQHENQLFSQVENDWWGIDVNDQDRMAVEQQGVVADRPNEHLGVLDGGIIQMRQMMRESLAAVEQGKDPLCIICDPSNQIIDFPRKSSMMQQKQVGVDYQQAFAGARA